jgi:hypothetical protein
MRGAQSLCATGQACNKKKKVRGGTRPCLALTWKKYASLWNLLTAS